MKTTKLFEPCKIKKFFNILSKLDRGIPIGDTKYLSYNKYNSHINKCAREVFVNRTINKWFKGKYLILYEEANSTKIQYKRYISISSIYFGLGYSDYLNIIIFDYAKPMEIFDKIKVDFNWLLNAEGEWINNPKNYHLKLLEMTILNIPKKKYIFNAYDFKKYPKRVRKGTDPKDKIKIKVFFNAQTEKQAYNRKRNFENKTNIIVGNLIKIEKL